MAAKTALNKKQKNEKHHAYGHDALNVCCVYLCIGQSVQLTRLGILTVFFTGGFYLQIKILKYF
jgi:hypothetical protein